jgi:imidazole glycerol-phosphate synthase subunit HisH
MIGIIDYGAGNLRSLQNALEWIGETVRIIVAPSELDGLKAIIVPGVGAFGAAMDRLRSAGFVEPLRDWAMVDRRPLLGICLGMQLMARNSREAGEHEGLGIFDATVEAIRPSASVKVPHMGWNELVIRREGILLRGLERPVCYFVHGYCVPLEAAESHCTATCDHGGEFAAVIESHNLMGVQFHPEKSQRDGLQVLKNFAAAVREW